MQNVFLSFSFRKNDEELVHPTIQTLEKLLESFDIRPISGEYLAGEPLTDAIKSRIEACIGFIALLTPDGRKKSNGKYAAHAWAFSELTYARAKNIPSIALLHQDVENTGIFQDHEYAPWNPKSSLVTILKVAQAIGQWKRTRKPTKIKIIPEDVGIKIARYNEKCSYRILREGSATPWLEAFVSGEIGGAFVHIPGVQEDALIELKTDINGERWGSRATPQFLQVELQKEAK